MDPIYDVELEKASELLKDPYDDARIFLQLHGGQSIASNSTLQSELIGASTTADKAAWFYYFMESYPFLFGVETAPSIPLFIDNQACLSVTNHPNNTKSRHIALRELVRNKRLS